MLNTLLEWDQYFFHLINSDLHHPILDYLLPIFREKTTWIPFYILVIAWVAFRFKTKALVYALALVCTVAIADTVSSRLIKKTVKRVRPCNDLTFKDDVQLMVHCGGGYSFTSSHATNHFAVAMFLIGTIGLMIKKIKIPLLIWAGSIALAQVYVGVHYPFDVIMGGILGSIIGYFCANFYNLKTQVFVDKTITIGS